MDSSDLASFERAGACNDQAPEVWSIETFDILRSSIKPPADFGVVGRQTLPCRFISRACTSSNSQTLSSQTGLNTYVALQEV